tara:strand:- start:315 stop:518 length:204 start_codon:yes stop_codon:yes gene_type:complete
MADFNKPAFENTYRLEPKESDRFYPSKIRSLIQQIVTSSLQDKEYDHVAAKTMAEKIADEIKVAVKA